MSESPWLAEKAWANNKIASRVTREAWVLLGFSLLLLAMSAPSLLDLPTEIRRENYLILLALIFPLIGLGMMVAWLRRLIQFWRFGASPLEMHPFPAVIGGHCGGKMDLNIPYSKDRSFALKLVCARSYVTRSGGKSTRREEVRWYQEGYAYSAYASNNRTSLTFCFDVPSNLPETELKQKNYHFWTLQVKAKVDGKDFNRAFRIPVFKTNGPDSFYSISDAMQHPANSSRIDERIEQLQLEDDGRSISITHSYGRRFWERVGIAVFGAVFVASGIGTSIAGAPFIFPLLFVPIGGAFVVFALYALINHYKVFVTAGEIQTRRTVLGLFTSKRSLAPSELKKIEKTQASVWQGRQGEQKHFYSIKAVLSSGKRVTLIEKLEGKVAAEEMVARLKTRFFESS